MTRLADAIRRRQAEHSRSDPDMVAGVPGLYEGDAAFIAGTILRSKWAKPDPPEAPKPAGKEELEALREEARRLRAEVAILEGQRHAR